MNCLCTNDYTGLPAVLTLSQTFTKLTQETVLVKKHNNIQGTCHVTINPHKCLER